MLSAVVLGLLLVGYASGEYEVSPKGYVVYCPCMGRFGNQVEQLLGSLTFSRSLGRTLVLPPFVEYSPGQPQAAMTPFEKYFSVKALQKSYSVIPMRDFMKQIAPKIWPPESRKAFCWNPHASVYDKEAPAGCHAKEGNPFGPFWEYSKVDFVGDIYYGAEIEGGHELSYKDTRKQWNQKFPASKYPVLSFVSAPASFPAKPDDRYVHHFIKWTSFISEKASEFIKNHLERPFIGIHLRNDLDWENVCKHIDEGHTKKLFGSAQCIGEYGELGNLTKEMCQPSLSTILEDVESEVRRTGAKSVFVSSDREHYIDELREHLAPFKVSVHKRDPDDAQVSLAILGRSDYFIGNCVSTFSSFVYRERKFGYETQMPTSFFAFHPDQIRKKRIEL